MCPDAVVPWSLQLPRLHEKLRIWDRCTTICSDEPSGRPMVEAQLQAKLARRRTRQEARGPMRARLCGTLALILVAAQGSATLTLAQVQPQVRDRVIPAAVQVALIVDVTTGGVTESMFLPVGSGTVVSPNGQILT